MNRILIALLAAASFSLGALPAMAHDIGSSLAVTIHLNDNSSRVRYRPPVYAVVKESAHYRGRDAKHSHRHHPSRNAGRDYVRGRDSCGEPAKVIRRTYYRDDHDHRPYRQVREVYRGEERHHRHGDEWRR